MELFDTNLVYTSKEVQEKMKISRSTLNKYCKGSLTFTTLPGAKTRRFSGSALNKYFGLSGKN